jgi:hypothetical protein
MIACVGVHNERTEALPGLLLCARDRRRLDDNTREIALLLIDSQAIAVGGITGPPVEQNTGGHSPKKRADPPAPGDVTLMALLDARTSAIRLPGDQSEPMPAVLAVVASWLLLIAEERPLTAMLPRSVLAQLDLLTRHHEWIASKPWVDDYLLEFGELRKALTAVVRDVRFERRGVCRLPVESGVCGGTLVEENGTRIVRCVGCGARWITDQERARLAVSLEAK